MAKVKQFDGKKYKGNSFPTAPKGQYKLEIFKSENSKSSNNDPMLTLDIKIVKGEFKGVSFKERLLQDHDSETVVQISRNTMMDINRACGFGDKLVKDTEKWHGKVFLGQVKLGETDKGNPVNSLAWVVKEEGDKTTNDRPVWDEGGDEKKKEKKKKKGKKK